jgi:thiamine transporter ThiT
VVGCLVRRWWDRFWVDVVVGCLVRRFAYLIAGVVFMVATAPS